MKKSYLGILIFLLVASLGSMIFLRKERARVVQSLENFQTRMTDTIISQETSADSLQGVSNDTVLEEWQDQ